MTGSENNHDELEKLLADVQRTIRENDQFIRHLKEEAAVVDESDEEPDDAEADDGGFEEL